MTTYINVRQVHKCLSLSHCARRRWMSQAALAVQPSSNELFSRFVEDIPDTRLGRTRGRRRRAVFGALTPRNNEPPTTVLGKRVEELVETAEAETSHQLEPSLTEDELLLLYEDLLSEPASATRAERAAAGAPAITASEDDMLLVEQAKERLLPLTAEAQVEETEVVEDYTGTYVSVLDRVQASVERMEKLKEFVPEPSSVNTAILSQRQFEALLRVSLEQGDGESAERTLTLAQRSGYPLAEDESSINTVLKFYASKGDISGTESFMTRFLTTKPTPEQRHLHIKTHLRSVSKDEIPTSALTVLHDYESQSLPAPMSAYTSVINHLFSGSSTTAHAHAWDLFSHMRYVAHPLPDSLLYAVMIRACSLTYNTTEPERALDLWTEMTVDNGIEPTRGAYNAIIFSCARSGRREWVEEAFRIARQMMDGRRNAAGELDARFTPDRWTFIALLEGAKRVGMLERVRWLLAEIVRQDGEGLLDEEMMMHIFHAYAAYKPPFRREDTVKVHVQPQAQVQKQDNEQTTLDSEANKAEDVQKEDLDVTETTTTTFTHIPPQSSNEVIAEAQTLFTRILEDKGLIPSPPVSPLLRKFASVDLTPRMVNSYLSVWYAHATIASAQRMYEKVWDIAGGVEKTLHTYVEALERCARAQKGEERKVARAWAEQVWTQYQEFENNELRRPNGREARLVERSWSAMIRLATLTDRPRLALSLVREFTRRYPPEAVDLPTQTATKPLYRSSRTSLVFLPPSSLTSSSSTSTALSNAPAGRPLVRLTSQAEQPDDSVPPFLTFRDLEVLHHALVKREMGKEIGFVKWACTAYQGALKSRREKRMKARVVAE